MKTEFKPAFFIFIILMFSIAIYSAFKSSASDIRSVKTLDIVDNKIDSTANSKVSAELTRQIIDSIQNKIDYRYTSYDNRFFYNTGFVVDDNDSIIGKIIIFTNDTELDSFYSASGYRKTKFYKNIKNRTLQVKEK